MRFAKRAADDFQASGIEEQGRMPDRNDRCDAEDRREQLARLAELLRLEIAEEELTTLATQLSLLEALEESELRDQPPILKMDADWHD